MWKREREKKIKRETEKERVSQDVRLRNGKARFYHSTCEAKCSLQWRYSNTYCTHTHIRTSHIHTTFVLDSRGLPSLHFAFSFSISPYRRFNTHRTCLLFSLSLFRACSPVSRSVNKLRARTFFGFPPLPLFTRHAAAAARTTRRCNRCFFSSSLLPFPGRRWTAEFTAYLVRARTFANDARSASAS